MADDSLNGFLYDFYVTVFEVVIFYTWLGHLTRRWEKSC